MKTKLQTGMSLTKHYVVEVEHVITFLGPDVPQVLASPWMLFFMEHAAREAVLPYLDAGKDTLGVRFEFEHVLASPIGAKITATAELVSIDDQKLLFKIEAHDEERGLIGQGRHVRAIVDVVRFANGIKSKMNS